MSFTGEVIPTFLVFFPGIAACFEHSYYF